MEAYGVCNSAAANMNRTIGRIALLAALCVAVVPALGCGVITSLISGIVGLIEGTKTPPKINAAPIVTLTAPTRIDTSDPDDPAVNFDLPLRLLVVDAESDDVRIDLFWSTDSGETWTAATSIIGSDVFAGSPDGHSVTMVWDADADLPTAGEYRDDLMLRIVPVQTADGLVGAERIVGPLEYGNSAPVIESVFVEMNQFGTRVKGTTVVRFVVSDSASDSVEVVKASAMIGQFEIELTVPDSESPQSADFPGGSFFNLATNPSGIEHNLTWNTNNTIIKTPGVTFSLQVRDRYGMLSTIVDSGEPFVVNNNEPPTVVIEEFFPPFGHPVPMLYNVFEPEGQPIHLEFEFSVDNGASWQRATEFAAERSAGHGPLPTMAPVNNVPQPTQLAFLWDISRDAPTAGTVKMRVRATDALGDSSFWASTPVVAADPELVPAISSGHLDFVAEQTFALDFDNDGDTDVFTVGHEFNTDTVGIWLYRNVGGLARSPQQMGNSGLAHTTDFLRGHIEVMSGDFNNNGFPDIVFAYHDTTFNLRVGILENINQLTPPFNYISTIPIAIGPSLVPVRALAVADFDGDGNLDIVVVADFPVVFFGDGNFGFTRVPLNLGPCTGPMAVGDFNSDGYPDFVVANAADANKLWVFHKSTQGFDFDLLTPEIEIPGFSSYEALMIFAADLDDDGATDLVVVMTEDAAVSFRQDAGELVFVGAHANKFGTDIIGAAVADFTGNGLPDLVIARQGKGADLLANTGTGLPTMATRELATSSPNVVPLDFDGDGLLDLYTGGFRYRHLTRQFANYQQPTPTDETQRDVRRLTGLLTDAQAQVVTGDFSSNGDADLLAGRNFWAQAPWGNRLRDQPLVGEEHHPIAVADFTGNSYDQFILADAIFAKTYMREAQDGLLSPIVPIADYAATAAVAGNFSDRADNQLDLALFFRGFGSFVEIYQTQFDGTFALQHFFFLPAEFDDDGEFRFDVMDVDGNGLPDIVIYTVGHFSGQNWLKVFYQYANNTYVESDDIPTGSMPVVIGEMLDGVGFEGLELYAPTLSLIHHRNASGQWDQSTTLAPIGLPSGASAFRHAWGGDIDGDGRIDFVGKIMGDAPSDPLRTYYSIANNEWEPGPLLAGPADRENQADAVIADFTGNGLPDLLVTMTRNFFLERTAILFTKRDANGRIEEPAGDPIPFAQLYAAGMTQIDQLYDMNRDGMLDVFLRGDNDTFGLLMSGPKGLRGVTQVFTSPVYVIIDRNSDGNPDLDLGTKGHVQVSPASVWTMRRENVPIAGDIEEAFDLRTTFTLSATRAAIDPAVFDAVLGLDPPIAPAVEFLQTPWRFFGDVRLGPYVADTQGRGVNDGVALQLKRPADDLTGMPEFLTLRIPVRSSLPNDFVRVLATAGDIRVFRHTVEMTVNSTVSYPESLYGSHNPSDPNSGTAPSDSPTVISTTTTFEFPQTTNNGAFSAAESNRFRIDTDKREIVVRTGKTGIVAIFGPTSFTEVPGNQHREITEQAIPHRGSVKYYKVFTSTGSLNIHLTDFDNDLSFKVYDQSGNLLLANVAVGLGVKTSTASTPDSGPGWLFVRVFGTTENDTSDDFSIEFEENN